MNKNEFNRMISLADEKYVDEIFEDRLSGKRKNIFVTFTAAAAALAVTVVGIGYFVSTAGDGDIAVTDPSTVMIDDIADTEITDVTVAVVPIDCEEIFRNKSGEFPITFCPYYYELDGNNQNVFDAEYAKSVIPFSTEGYSDERSQFYSQCDDNDLPYGISLHLESEFNETASPKFRSINVCICEMGKLSHEFPLEEAEPLNCFGVDIYGFDDTENYYSGAYDRNLKAYFVLGNTEYAVETSNLSCEETVTIIRDIIQSGFTVTSFDMDNGHDFDYKTEDISLAEANEIEPFAGHVPQLENVMSLYKGVTYAVEKNDGENVWSALYFSFSNNVRDDTNEKRILFNYYTREWRDTKSFYNVINLQDITRKSLDAYMVGDEYKFTLTCDGFMINVTAKCEADELWAYIGSIVDDTFSTENDTITLAEAANTPFAELVPKTEKIGGLSVGNIYLEQDGDNTTLTMDYSSQGRVGTFSYYGLVYHTDSRQALETVVPIELVTKEYIEQLAAEPSGAGNNRRFEFSIDCGAIWINIYGECTSNDIFAFFECIKDDTYSAENDTITLAEAKAIEPFSEYIPESEIGNMKLEKGIINYYDKEPMSLHFTFSDGTNSIIIAYLKDDDLSHIPAEYIIPIETVDWTAVNNFVENKKAFYIDCGEIKILVDAECQAEQVWEYISAINSNTAEQKRKLVEEEERKRQHEEEAERDRLNAEKAEQERKRTEEEAAKAESSVNLNLISLEKLKELAEKGDGLMWDDFDGYDFEEVGSGLYIRVYGVEGGYTIMVGGGSLKEKPMYVYLDGNNKRIDMRYESIDDILN